MKKAETQTKLKSGLTKKRQRQPTMAPKVPKPKLGRAKEQIEGSDNRLRVIIETVPSGIEEIDSSGIITFANGPLHKLYNYEEGELIGKSILEFASDDSEREFLRAYLKALVDEQPPRVPYLGKKKKKDGGIIDVQVDWSYKRDDQGRVTGFMSLITDITARKWSEEALRTAQHELEGKVQERTEQLVKVNEALTRQIGERMRSEEALRQSEASLAEAQRVAHFGSWEWDIVKNEIALSNEMCNIFGVPQQDASWSFETGMDFVHPDDRELVRKSMDEALHERKLYNIDFRIVRPDGSERIVNSQGGISFDDAGRPIRMVGTALDTTERKRTEEMLRSIVEGTASVTGSEFFRSLVRHLASVLQVRYAFVAECMDSAATRVRTLAFWTGEDLGENFEYSLAGTPCDKVVEGEMCYHPEGLQVLFPEDKDLVEIGAQSYWGAPLFDSSGKTLGHLAVLDDKPMRRELRFERKSILEIFAARGGAELERKQIEEVLRDSKRRFRTIFESAPTGIVSVSISGVFQHTNPTFRALLGYTEQELKGMTFIDVTHPDDVGESRSQFGELLHGKRDVLDVEKRYRRKDGSIVWAKTRAVPVRNERGELQNLLALVTDITELKRAEEALHRAHDELEMEVQKRTKELMETNEALRENEATLRRSQEELRALTAQLISVQEEESKHLARELHDAFSQRLAMLGMEVSALEQQLPSFPDSVGERLRLMGDEIGGLAKDVHQLSRRLHPSILDDLGLVVALRAECAAFSEQHGFPVEFLPKNVPESFPENVSLCLYRVARESLRNIAKHAEAEEVHVTLAGTDNGIVLTIEDIGSGFDLAQIKGKGGLGLISMEERARLLNGSFLVRSQPGQGTKVEVNIPLNGGGG